MSTPRWKDCVLAVQASKRADCGHQVHLPRLVWLRTERAGGVVEVWSVCAACATEKDYLWRGDLAVPPTRTNTDTLTS